MSTFSGALNLSGKALSISYENKFLGEDFGYYSRVKRLSFNGIVDSRFDSPGSGVSESLTTYNNLLSSAHSHRDIIINGRNFGKGKITSIDLSENPNPIRMGGFRAEIEVYEKTGVGSYQIDQNEVGFSNYFHKLESGHLIESFSESFSFDIGEDSSYSYNHSVDFKFVPFEPDTPFGYAQAYPQLAQRMAGTFLNTAASDGSNDDFGYVMGAGYSGMLDDARIQAGKTMADESYDLTNLSFSFSKKFTAIESTEYLGANWHKHSRSITRDQAGDVQISENGQIQGSSLAQAEDFLLGVTGSGSTAYNRCLSLFNDFQTEIQVNPGAALPVGGTGGTGPAGTSPAGVAPTGPDEGPARVLYSKPIEVRVSKNKHNFKIDYTVTFSNNLKYTNDGIWQHSHNISENFETGEVSVSERGTIRPYGKKSKSFDGSATLSTILSNSTTRINNLITKWKTYTHSSTFNQRSDEIFRKVKVTVDYPINGPEISYTIDFLNDGSFLSSADESTTGLKNMLISVSDTHPVMMRKPYLVPNFKEIVQDGLQTEVATRTITIESQKVRSANYLTNPPNVTTQLTVMMNSGIKRMLDIIRQKNIVIKELFVTGIDYSFSSEGKLSMKIQVSYTSVNVDVKGINEKHFLIKHNSKSYNNID